MKTLDLFVVELEKPVHDEIVLQNGAKLFVDSKFNEFKWRVTEGPVVCAPLRHETGVEEGDTLYFHHLVVVNEGQVLTGHDNHYLVRYDPAQTTNNQAIAYKNKKGVINTLAGWALIKPVFEEEESSDLIETVKLQEATTTKGIIAFDAPYLEEAGVACGDIVVFRDNMQYKITIDETDYYRVRVQDLLYVEEEIYDD
jgi:co-chaperonin GroES (HSP10)